MPHIRLIPRYLVLAITACYSFAATGNAQQNPPTKRSAGESAFLLARGTLGDEPVVTLPPPPVEKSTVAPAPASESARGDLSQPEQALIVEKPLVALGATLAASALAATLDREGERFGRLHGHRGIAKSLASAGSALPLLALGVAGVGFVTSDDPRFQRTSLAALEAGGGAMLTSIGLKYAFGRSRPESGAGPGDFHPFKGRNGNSSLPSIHSAAIWGTLTPYAKEYDQPWLYGLALLTNYGRVAERKHWVSDTVAGAAIGYLAGDLAWHWNRKQDESAPRLGLTPKSINMRWTFW